METKDDGGPAFPVVKPEDWKEACHGMTLRDYFAGQVLASMFQSDAWDHYGEMAESAYAVADAMLAARNTTP